MNEKYNLRTGVIGVGSMGQNHARIYSETSNFIAIADPNEVNGRKIAERFGVKWFKNYSDMLNLVDAVSIAVPTSIHLSVSKDVANSGVNILLEKPMAENSDDAKQILDCCKKNNVTLALGHVERHNPVISIAKKSITNKDWGDLITLYSKRVSNFPSRIHDVGVLLDLLVHDLDISKYLVDCDSMTVYASGGKMKADHEDYANITMRNTNGIISVCEANWLTPMKIRKLGITTSKGFFELDYQNQSIEFFSSEYKSVSKQNLFSSKIRFKSEFLDVEKKEPLLLEIVNFLDSIINSEKPLVTGEDGLDVVRLSEISIKSLKQDKSFRVNLKR